MYYNEKTIITVSTQTTTKKIIFILKDTWSLEINNKDIKVQVMLHSLLFLGVFGYTSITLYTRREGGYLPSMVC